ncbi:MAG: alpha/beta hydrolase [Clostridia bacterium]|nr:alpha/beta hydrolase [Clostridia bacterium]
MRKIKKSIKENKIPGIILKASAMIIILYILVCTALYFYQDKLIFWPQQLSDEARSISAVKKSGIEELELKMKDGTVIRGWFVKNNGNEKTNLLIYFGGNAEEVSRNLNQVSKFQNWSVALFNYRGYGASEGTTGERTMFSDALEIYDYFSKREDIDRNNIAVWGRSIGTGVAAYLSSQRQASAVILTSPYDSLGSVVKEKMPFLPVGLVLKHRFDSIGRAPSIKSPLLIIVGSEDTTIPAWHSRKLAERWGGKVSFQEIIGEDHNSISKTDGYWNRVSDFLEKQQ